jgi:hypothetical protein
MKLANAAKLFDRLTCADAYSPLDTFNAQFDLFDDTKRDGLTAQRRILSTAPGVVLPARKTLGIDGEHWIVGELNKDFYKHSAIRYKYIMHQAEGLATVKTPEQTLAAAAGFSAYAGRTWVKTSKEIEISSEMTNVYDLVFADSEAIAEDQFILLSGRWFLVRGVYQSPGGFLMALSDELEEPALTTANVNARVYQPVADTYTDAIAVVPAIRIRWQSHFRYLQRAATKFKAGDIVLLVRKTDIVAPEAGHEVSVAGQNYLIAAVIDDGSVWALHLNNA